MTKKLKKREFFMNKNESFIPNLCENNDDIKLAKYLLKAGLLPYGVQYDPPMKAPFKDELKMRNAIHDSIAYNQRRGSEYDFFNYIIELPNIFNISPYFRSYTYAGTDIMKDYSLGATALETDIRTVGRIATAQEKYGFNAKNANFSLIRNLFPLMSLDKKIQNLLSNNLGYFMTTDAFYGDCPSSNIAINILVEKGDVFEYFVKKIEDNLPASYPKENDLLRKYILEQLSTCDKGDWKKAETSYDGMKYGFNFGGVVDLQKLKALFDREFTLEKIKSTFTSPEKALYTFKSSKTNDIVVKLNKYFGCIGAIAMFNTVAPKQDATFFESKKILDLAYRNPLALATLDNARFKQLIDETEHCIRNYCYSKQYQYFPDSHYYTISKENNNAIPYMKTIVQYKEMKKVSCSADEARKHKLMVNELTNIRVK